MNAHLIPLLPSTSVDLGALVRAPFEEVAVVLPTLNEASNLRRLCCEISSATPGAHIVIVDDASSDRTAEIGEELARENPYIHLMRRAGQRTFGGSCRQAFQWALDRDFEVVAVMDADFSHDPAQLATLLEEARDGAEVVVGSRYLPASSLNQWGRGRLLLSRCARFSSGLAIRLGLTDPTSGYRVYSRAALKKIDLSRVHARGFVFQVEMLKRALEEGVTIREVPIEFRNRAGGQSKMSWRHALEGALRLVRWRLS